MQYMQNNAGRHDPDLLKRLSKMVRDTVHEGKIYYTEIKNSIFSKRKTICSFLLFCTSPCQLLSAVLLDAVS